MLFIFYYSQWQLTVPFRKARYCITQLENWSYLRLKNQQCSDLNSQAEKKKKKKKIEGNTAWPQGHTANSHSKPQKQPEEVPKSLCEYKLWFLSSSKVMLRKRVQNSTERLMITFKVVIAGKMQHLTIADTSENHSMCECVSVPSSLQHTPTGRSPAPTVKSSFLAPAPNIYFHECFS